METKPDLGRIRKEGCHFTAEYPLQHISIYIIGRLPRSNHYAYFFLFVDIVTKFVMVYPLRKTTAKDVLNRFEDYGKPYGFSENVLTDNGSQLTSRIWKKYMEYHNNQYMYTSHYYPQANPIKTCNKELGRLLRLFYN